MRTFRLIEAAHTTALNEQIKEYYSQIVTLRKREQKMLDQREYTKGFCFFKKFTTF